MKPINWISDNARRLLPLFLLACSVVLSLAACTTNPSPPTFPLPRPLFLPLALNFPTPPTPCQVSGGGAVCAAITFVVTSSTQIMPTITAINGGLGGSTNNANITIPASYTGTTDAGKAVTGTVSLSCNASATTCTGSKQLAPGDYVISVTEPVLWPPNNRNVDYYNPTGAPSSSCGGNNVCVTLKAVANFSF